MHQYAHKTTKKHDYIHDQLLFTLSLWHDVTSVVVPLYSNIYDRDLLQGLGKWVRPQKTQWVFWVVPMQKTHQVSNPVGFLALGFLALGFLALGFSRAKKNKWKPTKQLNTMPYWTS